MTYEAWRITYQSSEQAARAAYDANERLRAEIDNIKQVEFPRRVDKVVEGWRKTCDLLKADAARLDWLDAVNAKTNAGNGTTYGWKFDINHNRAALTDHNWPALKVREAIDAAMASAPNA